MISSSRAASLLTGLLPRARRAAASALASSSSSTMASSSAVFAPIAAAASSLRFFSSGVPMTEPLPGLTLPTPASSSAPAPATQLTTLPNGAKIASEDTPVRSFFLLLSTAIRLSSKGFLVAFFFLFSPRHSVPCAVLEKRPIWMSPWVESRTHLTGNKRRKERRT